MSVGRLVVDELADTGRLMEKAGSYFFRRAGEEREAARKATNRIVRDRHLEFAIAYDHRGREVEALERELIIPAIPLA